MPQQEPPSDAETQEQGSDGEPPAKKRKTEKVPHCLALHSCLREDRLTAHRHTQKPRESKRYRFAFTYFGPTLTKTLLPGIPVETVSLETDKHKRHYVVLTMKPKQAIRRSQLANSIHHYNRNKPVDQRIIVSLMPDDDDPETQRAVDEAQKLGIEPHIIAAKIRVFDNASNAYKDAVIKRFIDHTRASAGNVSALLAAITSRNDAIRDLRMQADRLGKLVDQLTASLKAATEQLAEEQRKSGSQPVV